MGISQVPTASAGGGIKLVQRGVSTVAETVTITAVDTAKAFVNTFPTASSGNVTVNSGTWNGQNQTTGTLGNSISASTSLTAKTFGAYLTGATTLVTTGACRWEVVEFA